MINSWVKKLNIGLYLGALLIFITSCSEQRRTKVKDYPRYTAFAFNNTIKINAAGLKPDQKQQLIYDLENYWDDSLRVKKLQRFGLFYTIKNPPAFNASNISRSISFMKSYLQSLGYYYATFNAPKVRYDTFKTIQYRTFITLEINLGNKVNIGKVDLKFTDSNLQILAENNNKNSLLITGDAYLKQSISSELDRLVNLFRRNGYYYFTREHLYAIVDSFRTTNIQKSNWDIVITNRPDLGTKVLKQLINGKIYYYPDTKDVYDTNSLKKYAFNKEGRNFKVSYNKYLFRSTPLINNTFLKSDSLYNESDYFKTVNAFNLIGAWNQIDIKPVIRNNDTIDYHIFMSPAKKQNITIDLEGSKNTGDITSGNLIGISTNISLKNRNLWKRAIQSYTTFNNGVELSSIDTTRLLQTFQFSINQTYVISKKRKPSSQDITQTLLSLNATYTDRFQIYKLRSIVGSWGSQNKRANSVFLFKPVNIELYSLEKFSGLDTLIAHNPFLKLSFNTGNVLSQSVSFIQTFPGHRTGLNHYIRLGAEVSGLTNLLIPSLNSTVYRYIKGEADYRFLKKYRKAELAYRTYIGLGYNLDDHNDIGKVLPFFKQFFAGGPNSMRAWGLRQLGLGSSLSYDTSSSSFKDRFGDIQLETNLEYRFTIFNFGSFNIGSAVFADIGNIWNMRNDPSDPNASLGLSNLGKSIAVAVGTGIRFDFSYFLIRIDAAYKVKDPARLSNSGWMDFNKPSLTEYRANQTEVRNYAIQLGIGLPF